MFALARLIRRTLRRFGKARDGTAAIEMGLIAVPFFTLLVGLAEVSMVGFMQTTLNNAVDERAREIRTGQAQQNGVTLDELKDSICQDIRGLLSVDCEANLFIDVDVYDSFVAAAAGPNPLANGLQDGGFEPGAPSEIVVVRAFYRWSVMTPLFEGILANTSGGDRILVSTMMFRNEPYE
ncbi:MAG: pilus assembly protein [Hyphomonadaceae bacterium]|nr:pilus assembly protein [Hyphomonadaceae bacterium]